MPHVHVRLAGRRLIFPTVKSAASLIGDNGRIFEGGRIAFVVNHHPVGAPGRLSVGIEFLRSQPDFGRGIAAEFHLIYHNHAVVRGGHNIRMGQSFPLRTANLNAVRAPLFFTCCGKLLQAEDVGIVPAFRPDKDHIPGCGHGRFGRHLRIGVYRRGKLHTVRTPQKRTVRSNFVREHIPTVSRRFVADIVKYHNGVIGLIHH